MTLGLWLLEQKIAKATNLYLDAEVNEEEYQTSLNPDWAQARGLSAQRYRERANRAARDVYDLLRELEG